MGGQTWFTKGCLLRDFREYKRPRRRLVRRVEVVEDDAHLVVGDVCDRGPDTRARGVRGNQEDWLCTFADGGGFDPWR